eukprot:Plantae.Rhodophyta-Purpureofilum_apyrenoidigerum.ctg131.p1 GENE.Plantae.Rhodophyta-Purpureofilum_apyrenoidigerum.ctg131~~Plantae.Rhodophyta-Purpureofilum_apyrenoidigerum.ctg131.p1  ORF type:complete len:691 (-),score=122.91 Plantae.Rhodophyta-Purpureofilum_apyrenoidigerum.ctg131:34-2106(-)
MVSWRESIVLLIARAAVGSAINNMATPGVLSTDEWNEIIAASQSGAGFELGDPLLVVTTNQYLWIVVVGGLFAFFMAWGIGANDVANAFATSVGAGSISLLWACVIAGVMEFLGAVFLGSQVTDTVRKKIIDPGYFDIHKSNGSMNGPEVLMTAFLAALVSASIWLFTATAFGLPVSTTHSIIGALIGVGLVYGGGDAVIWISDGSGLSKLKGVVGVIASWFISPILSAVFALILFYIVRTFVLRAKNPVKAGFFFSPVLYGFAVTIVMFFIIYKGTPQFNLAEDLGVGGSLGVAFGAGALAGIFTWFFINPLLRRMLARWETNYLERLKNPNMPTKTNKVAGVLRKIGVNVEVTEQLSDEVLAMHDNSEKFDLKTERLFTWVQVFTAAFDSFSHGANDVANSIGPFAAIFSIYNASKLSNRTVFTEVDNVQDWIDAIDAGETFDGTSAGCIVDPIEDSVDADGKANYFACLGQSDVHFPSLTPYSADATNKPGMYASLDDNDEVQFLNTTCYSECTRGNYAVYDYSKQPVEVWILALGGAGIVAGLSMWGYKIIVVIGTKLTKMTPSRGFCIELGASICVLLASKLGLPVSTTHCQVGATMGVGLAEMKLNTVNWKTFVAIFAGWVMTLVFAALVSAGIFAFAINTPQKMSVDSSLNYCPGQNLFAITPPPADGSGPAIIQGIGCSGQA